jgi:hypothetical protein
VGGCGRMNVVVRGEWPCSATGRSDWGETSSGSDWLGLTAPSTSLPIHQ